jgi:hypothetical protein
LFNIPIEKSKTKLEIKTEMFLAAVLRSHPRENFQKFSLPSSVNTFLSIFFLLSVGFSPVRTPFQLGLYNNENISDLSGKKTRRKFLW